MIFRRWGLVLLTALFTALVSPASIHSVGDGLKMAANTASSAKRTWRGVLQIWPRVGDFATHVAWTIGVCIETLLDFAI
jgi:hypothetical protein